MNAAAALICLVVGVYDGDTLYLRCGEQPQVKVRLFEVDAPERGQAFGKRAKEILSNLVFGRKVRSVQVDTDRNKRPVVEIYLNETYVNFEMVRMGMVWCEPRFVIRRECFDLEAAARGKRKGLWIDPNPMPPWEWRRQKRNKQKSKDAAPG